MGNAERLYGRPWSEREYVIALHYYFENRDSPRHENSDYIQELCKLLGRTPASIVMRMENFGSIDPETNLERKGLANVGSMCSKVFSDWKERRDSLQACADLLIREASAARTLNLFEPNPVTLPKAFDRYELLDRIGEGGFGSVFSCIDAESRKQYAIKIIRPDNRFDRETLHRFSREIRILSSINHPNVIRLHERNLDIEDTYPAFVMDLAQCSLAHYLQLATNRCNGNRPCLERSEATSIVRSISSGVQALHSSGIIHRDINPNNILMLSDGTWVLADFGLAKFLPSAAAATTFVTNTHVGWGTAYYAAPEQYRDFKRTDERTDIYALGMLMWELFSSSWPPPDIRTPGIPSGLEATFLRSIEREPEARHQSVADFIEELELAKMSNARVALNLRS
jgi:serine/threonine protein kinase